MYLLYEAHHSHFAFRNTRQCFSTTLEGYFKQQFKNQQKAQTCKNYDTKQAVDCGNNTSLLFWELPYERQSVALVDLRGELCELWNLSI